MHSKEQSRVTIAVSEAAKCAIPKVGLRAIFKNYGHACTYAMVNFKTYSKR